MIRPQPKTSTDICNEFGLANSCVDFTEEDFKGITNYKLFSQHVRPIIVQDNPKIAQAKLVVLLGARWREFVAGNPFKGQQSTQMSDRPESSVAVVSSLPPASADSASTPQRGRSFCFLRTVVHCLDCQEYVCVAHTSHTHTCITSICWLNDLVADALGSIVLHRSTLCTCLLA